jgi:hypothetical protein
MDFVANYKKAGGYSGENDGELVSDFVIGGALYAGGKSAQQWGE